MKAAEILMWGEKNRAKFGFIYNTYCYEFPNDFAPNDWKVATVDDYQALVDFVGTLANAGGKLKSTDSFFWDSPNTGATDEYGFSLVGGGYRNGNTGVFSGFKTICLLNSGDTLYTPCYMASYDSTDCDPYQNTEPETTGAPLRLLYNGSGTPPSTITDYDGNIYDVIQIGTQYWTKQNWKCTHLNDGTPIPNVTDNTAWSNLTTLGRCAYNNDESNV